MHTSLLRKCGLICCGRDFFYRREALRRQLEWNRRLGVRGHVGCGVGVGLGDDLGLPDLDEDDGPDQDDQYRYDGSDDDGSHRRVSYATFRRGIASRGRWRLVVFHELIGCRSGGWWLGGSGTIAADGRG
jgi:hypothetical protein